MEWPKTLEQLRVYKYGESSVDKGAKYNPEKCGYEVYPPLYTGNWSAHQCRNGKYKDELYCLKHMKQFKRQNAVQL